MEQHCARCGRVLGVGRFCTNCGHPVGQPVPADDDWVATSTRLPVITDRPPATYETPVPPRYPLYAEGERPSTDVWTPAGRTRGVLPWMVGLLGVLLVIALVVLIVRDDDGDRDPRASETPNSGATSDESSAPIFGDGDVIDVTADASAVVPATAPPSRDVDGAQTTYVAENLLDGDRDTAWRMPGDGTDSEIVIVLAERTVVSGVGLINGYAKKEQGYNGYKANRRVRLVEWVFDDGTVVEQRLRKTRKLQAVSVDDVLTGTITLRLVSVSKPGPPPSGRDFTAISDLAIGGTPA